MSKTMKNIPKVRFPEFRDDGEWEEKPLKKYVISYKGGAPLTPSDFVNEMGYEVVPKKAITSDGVLLLDQNKPTFCSKVFFENNQNSVIDQTYLITTLRDLVPSGPNIGYIVNNTFKKPLILAQGVYGFQIKENELEKNFIIQYSNRLEYRRLMQKMMVGSTQVHIRNNDFFGMSILLPSIEEQQKIAKCLSSLDALILAHSGKVEALKAHKKALMQQLFPAEGETTPRLRFPEFQNDGEWEEKPLNKISPVIFDGTHQTPSYVQEGVPFFSVENLVSGNKNKFISTEDYYIVTSKNKPENGDILVTRIGNIGFSKVVDWNYDFSIYVTLAVIKKSKEFNSYYLHFFIQSKRYQNELLKKSLLNAVPCKINMDSLRNTLVLLPKPKEQQKIAKCLSSLDALISAQSSKVEALKQHKKALMQQLFPTCKVTS